MIDVRQGCSQSHLCKENGQDRNHGSGKMDNSFINMAEAFIKMSESLLRLVKAIKRAQASFDAMLRLQYRTAGSPFGDSEEGLRIWRAKMSENIALNKTMAAGAGTTEPTCGLNCADSQYLPGRFIFLSEEISKRLN